MIPPDATVGVDTTIDRVWSPVGKCDMCDMLGAKRCKYSRGGGVLCHRILPSVNDSPHCIPFLLTCEQVLGVLHDGFEKPQQRLGEVVFEVVLRRRCVTQCNNCLSVNI